MAFETDPPRRLTKDEIWAADDIVEQEVLVPQWGGSVRIRTFSKKQAAKMTERAKIRGVVNNDNLEALLFCEGVIDPHFDVEEYAQVEEKSAVAVGLILKAIMDASGLSDLAVAEADKSAGTGPNATLRVLPGTRAKDDTGGTLATDVGG